MIAKLTVRSVLWYILVVAITAQCIWLLVATLLALIRDKAIVNMHGPIMYFSQLYPAVVAGYVGLYTDNFHLMATFTALELCQSIIAINHSEEACSFPLSITNILVSLAYYVTFLRR